MFSTVLAAVIAVFASMAFPVKMTLANAATDTSAPQGIVEVLNNLLLNVVANPVSSLVNANYVGILMWAVLYDLWKTVDSSCRMYAVYLFCDQSASGLLVHPPESISADLPLPEEKCDHSFLHQKFSC